MQQYTKVRRLKINLSESNQPQGFNSYMPFILITNKDTCENSVQKNPSEQKPADVIGLLAAPITVIDFTALWAIDRAGCIV